MTVGNARATTLAPPGTPRQPRHLRRQARLVDEDQPGRIEVELAVKPGLALSQDLRPLLLQCVRGFFVREATPAQPVVQRAPANPDVALVREARHHLIERDVLVSLNQAHDEAFMPLKARPASTTGRSWLHLTGFGPRYPADRGRWLHTKPRRRTTRRQTRLRCLQNTNPQIATQCSSHPRPPCLETFNQTCIIPSHHNRFSDWCICSRRFRKRSPLRRRWG